MAALGSGGYNLNYNVSPSKQFVYMKLTDSAYQSIEEFLKIKSTCNTTPSIEFIGNEGVIKIPSRSPNAAVFRFQLQSVDDMGGTQGSFECIRQQGNKNLEALGPMKAKIRIQAKDDSYHRTAKKLQTIKENSESKSIREVDLKTKSVGRRNNPNKKELTDFVPTRQPTHNMKSSLSPHNSNLRLGAKNGLSSLSNKKEIKRDPELLKKPLRERILHLLAVKPYKKIEIHHRLSNEGMKERDKKHWSQVLLSVAHSRENLNHIQKHLWNEVNENWPFYTPEEKELVKNLKYQHVHPEQGSNHSAAGSATNGRSPTNPTSRSPPGMSGANKRPRDVSADNRAVKRHQSSPHTSDPAANSGWRPNGIAGPAPHESRRVARLEERPPVANGHHSPKSSFSLQPGKQSPRRNGERSPPETHRHSAGLDRYGPSMSMDIPASQPINGRTNGLNGHREREEGLNGHHNNGLASNNVPADDKDYLRTFTPIETEEQRRRYKDEFAVIFNEHLELNDYLAAISNEFEKLDIERKKFDMGTPEYLVIREKILQKFNELRPNFEKKRDRYNYLIEVLRHIKITVQKYDTHRRPTGQSDHRLECS